jgi:hypothetical protein
MNSRLLARLEKAIDKVIQDSAEDCFWDQYIHDELPRQMADAAASVFDASMHGQAYAAKENE